MEAKEIIGALMWKALPYEDFMTGMHTGWLFPLIGITLIVLVIALRII
jgi:hypothetical protein